MILLIFKVNFNYSKQQLLSVPPPVTMGSFWVALTRKKTYSTDDRESKLARVLTLFDLTALGVGSTLGLGVYVLAGAVAYDTAGPAVTISFLIAAIASTFAGLCYAEFAARIPKAGSAYVYSYVTIGEFVAFTIGWNMLLEYAIGTSSVARGMSGYIDSLANGTMSNIFRGWLTIDSSFLAEYPDFLSVVFIAILTAILISGVKESSHVNNLFTTINMVTVIMVLVIGIWKSDPANWSIAKEEIPEKFREKAGEGGFNPFGVAGILAGAAKCFYGFVGFDCVATTGEEAKRPERNVPLSIVISLVIIFLSYFGISTVLTMMWPYYMQDPKAPFPHVFQELNMPTVKWIVSVGAICALVNSLVGALFPAPRVLYAMAEDGVLFKKLSFVNAKTQTPVFATIFCGVFAGVMALIFDLDQLIDMMSIGTLMAYTIVAVSVLVLRYRDDENSSLKEMDYTNGIVLRQMLNMNSIKSPNNLSSRITTIGVSIYGVITIVFCIFTKNITELDTINSIIFAVLAAGMVLCVAIIACQPTSQTKLTFRVPWVPVLPCVSILMNLFLMFQLDIHTWARLGLWLILGYIIYFLYGIRHSKEKTNSDGNNVVVINVRSNEAVKMESTKF